MDLASHYAAFPGLSLLNTRTVLVKGGMAIRRETEGTQRNIYTGATSTVMKSAGNELDALPRKASGCLSYANALKQRSETLIESRYTELRFPSSRFPTFH
jgi:hypothetical protein